MHELLVRKANLDAYGVEGAAERAAEAERAYAAGAAAVAALQDVLPGPQLATDLLAVQQLALSPAAQVEVVGQWERLRSWTEAQSMAALAAAAGTPDMESDRWLVADVALTTHLSEHSVGTRLGTTRHVAEGLPASWEALNAGRITTAHLWVIGNVTREASAATSRLVEDAVLEKAVARGWTPAQLAEAARQALMTIDPEDAERRAREARKRRSDVTLRSDEDQMAALVARTDAWTGRQAMDEINRRADALRREGDTRSLGELRVAALARALLGDTGDPDAPATAAADGADLDVSPRPQPKRATVLLVMPLTTLLGGDHPAHLDGYGPVTAELARRVASGDATFRRLLVDPVSGKPLDLSEGSYELSGRMRRWIEARDRTCRFPSCRRRAVFCDVDHAVEWPKGKTTCANCGVLCRRHHNFKTAKAWTLRRNDDDSVDWISPRDLEWHEEAATYEEFLGKTDLEPEPEPEQDADAQPSDELDPDPPPF